MCAVWFACRPLAFGRGDDTAGDPHRAQFCQFELFELILLLKLDKRVPVERFEATASRSTVPSPPPKHLASQFARAALRAEADTRGRAHTQVLITIIVIIIMLLLLLLLLLVSLLLLLSLRGYARWGARGADGPGSTEVPAARYSDSNAY